MTMVVETKVEAGSIAARIRKPSPKINHFAVVIYGRGGTGKTTLLGTMPGKGLILDIPQVEGGTMVLSDKADRIDVLPVTKWADFSDAWEFLSQTKHDYKWVAIDTITAAQELAKRRTLKERDTGSFAGDPHQITMQDWGKIGELNKELYYRFKLLPFHLILTAQELLKGTGEDGTLEYQPNISPASQNGLTAMHVIGRLYTREVSDGTTKERTTERRLRVGAISTAVAKARAVPGRAVPPVIKNPNLGQILGYLAGQDVPAPEGVQEDLGFIELS